MNNVEISAMAMSGGQSSKVVTGIASAQSETISQPASVQNGAPVNVLITCDVLTFGRYDPAGNPTAASDGTDQAFAANMPYRTQVKPGGKFAFIVPSGTGNVYLTPEG